MSQLLQVHIANQRLMKTASGENSPGSPGMMMGSPGGGSGGPMSPLSIGPSSPQGMPIPRRIMGQDQMQHGGAWIMNPSIGLSGGTMISANGGLSSSGWNGMNNMMMGDNSMEGLELPVGDMSMEGELSKLSMAVDEDDIFKMNRNELLGPTLAELNAPDADTLLDGLNFDDLYWPMDGGPQPEATPSPQTPAGGNNPLDPDGDIVFQIQPSSSFPPLGTHKLILAGSSVPPTILEQTLLQPSLIMNDMKPQPSHTPPPPSSLQPSRYTF
jgi:hypothetical protein